MPQQRNVLLALGRYDFRTHRGVAQYAGQHHWHLNAEMGVSGRLPHGWRGDGILTALDFQKDLERFIRSATVPVVDLSLGRQDIPLPRVVGDHDEIGCLAAHHFLERGFRHFAWHANSIDPVAELRHLGFSRTLRAHGFACERWIWQPRGHGMADHWLVKSKWLARKLETIPKPAAVFAFRDAEAANVLDACSLVDFPVPDEVAILGVDNNLLICESLRVPLSSVNHDLDNVGYEGAALLDRLMNGLEPPRGPILIRPKGITTRRSTEVLAIHHDPSRRALAFLRDNYCRNIGVGDAVQAAGVARRTLDKVFREHVGRSIREELIRLRLARSKDLLRHSNLSVAKVATHAGFNTPQYFNRVFHGLEGVTPRKYRLARRP